MVTKLSPREKAALATQMMNKAVAPSPAPTSTTEAPFRQINSVQIGLAMAGQGGRVAELEKQLHETEKSADAVRADLVAVNAEWQGVLPSKRLALKSEMESAGGNVQAIKVRPIPGTEPQEYEIVFGHRRHRACLDLGLEVLATIESIDDKELFKEMDRENRQRADLRPYEQGLMYGCLAPSVSWLKIWDSNQVTFLLRSTLRVYPSPLSMLSVRHWIFSIGGPRR